MRCASLAFIRTFSYEKHVMQFTSLKYFLWFCMFCQCFKSNMLYSGAFFYNLSLFSFRSRYVDLLGFLPTKNDEGEEKNNFNFALFFFVFLHLVTCCIVVGGMLIQWSNCKFKVISILWCLCAPHAYFYYVKFLFCFM